MQGKMILKLKEIPPMESRRERVLLNNIELAMNKLMAEVTFIGGLGVTDHPRDRILVKVNGEITYEELTNVMRTVDWPMTIIL